MWGEVKEAPTGFADGWTRNVRETKESRKTPGSKPKQLGGWSCHS